MLYGYVRVSTPKQKPERQITNIKAIYPQAVIVVESYTGTSMDRPEWGKLERGLKQNDQIVFDEVSRMSRNAEEGFCIYEKLFQKDVDLIFIKQPHINTSAYRTALANVIGADKKFGDDATDELVHSILDALHSFMMRKVKADILREFEQAQAEVEHLHQRTKEGIAQARLAGKQIGQKKGAILTTKKSLAAKEIILKHSKTFGGTLKDEDVITLAGITRKTYYKYKRELKNRG